ncbi:CBM9 family sugar-binding protein [Alteromonas sp. CYL-A6]|uniref:CBM9 family sugar-binding protein n=1 Tax=Alteromonas nitratireducens TaxID=3390813 RepID=UPI0034AE0D2C
MYRSLLLSLLAALLCVPAAVARDAVKAPVAPVIDGHADAVWDTATWHSLDEHILGEVPARDDFSGRYKLMWDEQQLYLLVEIVDDVLIDTHPNPRVHYWDDDALEIFVDEDASGGEHTYSHNAFAYHIALDGNAVDLGDEEHDGKKAILLNDHLNSAWTRADKQPYTVTWEVALRIYPDTFTTVSPGTPVTLHEGKKMGFMLAYCDNDGSEQREHFMGSYPIRAVNGYKNLGYIDASVFERIVLKK